jgi:hypothetical protein
MLKGETLNIVSLSGSEIKATMSFDPMEAKEHLTWLLFLLQTPGFLKRYSFKQNSQGKINCKLLLTKRPDWQMKLADTKLSVASYLMKSES